MNISAAMEGKTAEVVETSSTAFVAQCYALYEAPPLGALLRVGVPPSVYAVLRNVVSGALEPGRRVVARGAEEESEEELYRSNPQLSRLLTTHLEALVVGYSDGDGLHHGLPPTPPRLHAFVYACAPEEVAAFTQRLDLLHLLVGSSVPAVDEIIIACLQRAAACHPDPAVFLIRAGRTLTSELGTDLGRLNAILRRLAP